MGWIRGLGLSFGAAVLLLAVTPVLALVPASVFDQAEGGAVRLTLFPTALVILNPYVWVCVWNSLCVAAVVTLGSGVVGVGLARLVARRRFLGRSPLLALAICGLVVPPAFGAIGLRWLFGEPKLWSDESAWASLIPRAGWIMWVWVAIGSGAPIVGLATASALGRVNPVLEDAAKLAGTDPRRVWRKIVWPLLKPDVSRALSLVFLLTLCDPGAPLVLGLRRTLSFQAVETALDEGLGQLRTAVLLALVMVVLSEIARLILGWWGGRSHESTNRAPMATRPHRSTPRSGVGPAFLLGVAVVAAWIPMIGIFFTSFSGSPSADSGLSGWGFSLGAYRGIVHDPLTRGYLANSAKLGLAVLVLDLVLIRALSTCLSSRRIGGLIDRALNRLEVFPPLAIGIGMLALPSILRMATRGLADLGISQSLVGTLSEAIDVVDVNRFPWVGLVLAVALVRLPLLASLAMERRREAPGSCIDAAIISGKGSRRAMRTVSGGWFGVSPHSAILTAALAGTCLTPALVLAPIADTRPIGPAVLILEEDQSGGLARSAAMATIALGVNLLALAIDGRARTGLKRDWLRA